MRKPTMRTRAAVALLAAFTMTAALMLTAAESRAQRGGGARPGGIVRAGGPAYAARGMGVGYAPRVYAPRAYAPRAYIGPSYRSWSGGYVRGGGGHYYPGGGYDYRPWYGYHPYYYHPHAYMSFGFGWGWPAYYYYAPYPVVVQQQVVVPGTTDEARSGTSMVDPTTTFDVTNAPPDGYFYYDKYCDQRFKDLDDYTDHLRSHDHAPTVEILQNEDGSRLHTLEFDGSVWRVKK